MAAPLTAEEQAIVNLQQELAETRAHVPQVIDGHEALKAVHAALDF